MLKNCKAHDQRCANAAVVKYNSIQVKHAFLVDSLSSLLLCSLYILPNVANIKDAACAAYLCANLTLPTKNGSIAGLETSFLFHALTLQCWAFRLKARVVFGFDGA